MSTDAPTAYAVFLDFDGTLVEIAPRPDQVRVAEGLPARMEAVRARLDGALAVVTGRPIATIDGFLAPARFDVAGLHGVERRMGDVTDGCRPEAHPALRAGVAALQRETADIPAILVEDKGCSVAVHWRLATPSDAERAEDVVAEIARGLHPAYRLQRGKAVAEILPATATKGHAIRAFLRAPPYAGRRAIFFGDDVTDEEGFNDVNADGGVSVRIGSGPTIAQRRLARPEDVRELLAHWADGAPVDPEALPWA
jgi:trehalose 6-phosphate phosphatase